MICPVLLVSELGGGRLCDWMRSAIFSCDRVRLAVVNCDRMRSSAVICNLVSLVSLHKGRKLWHDVTLGRMIACLVCSQLRPTAETAAAASRGGCSHLPAGFFSPCGLTELHGRCAQATPCASPGVSAAGDRRHLWNPAEVAPDPTTCASL